MPVDEVVEKENLLKDFSYSAYESIVPEEVREVLAKVFADQVYGWKRKAKIILRLQSAHMRVVEVESELIDACEGRSAARQPRSREDMARVSVRSFLEGLDESKLQRLAEKHWVSYNSFISKNDRVGLIEALVDAMLAGE